VVYAFDPFPGEDAPPVDFGLAVHPLSLSVAPLGECSALVRTWAGASSLPLSLSVARLPNLVRARFTPDRVDAGGEIKLVVSVAEAALTRTHALTIVATGPDGRLARAYLSLTIF
jgi:hypothetical protein